MSWDFKLLVESARPLFDCSIKSERQSGICRTRKLLCDKIHSSNSGFFVYFVFLLHLFMPCVWLRCMANVGGWWMANGKNWYDIASIRNLQFSIFLPWRAFGVVGMFTCIFNAGGSVNVCLQQCEPNSGRKNLQKKYQQFKWSWKSQTWGFNIFTII